MVYSCGVESPYATSPSYEPVGAKYEDMFEIKFQYPDEVDPIAKSHKSGRMNEGYAVDPETVPSKFQWGDKRKAVPDFIVYNATPIVSPRVKEIVEEFEPGAHQFIPIDLYHRKASESFATHYWFVICKMIDTIDEEKTTYELIRNKNTEGLGQYRTSIGGGILINNKAKIGAHHCWREKYVSRWWHMSDELVDRLDNEGMTGLGRTHFAEVA